MSTSYADRAQAREWDRRYDEWGRPRVPRGYEVEDSEDVAQRLTQAQEARAVRELAEGKARAIRISNAVDQYGAFFGLRSKSDEQ